MNSKQVARELVTLAEKLITASTWPVSVKELHPRIRAKLKAAKQDVVFGKDDLSIPLQDYYVRWRNTYGDFGFNWLENALDEHLGPAVVISTTNLMKTSKFVWHSSVYQFRN